MPDTGDKREQTGAWPLHWRQAPSHLPSSPQPGKAGEGVLFSDLGDTEGQEEHSGT